ncbi:MAG: amidohydrolase [Hyphomicrobiales bacterium]|nr:MAG: amidohydrolase [Hyphomicrobiales bacterium]
MFTVDFRIRPPFKSFLKTAMYAGAARRDGITRKVGFEPSPAAMGQSLPLLISEMDAAGVDKGVVVGRVSGALGNVDNADILEVCALHPGRFVPIAGIAPLPRKAAILEAERLLGLGFKGLSIEPGGLPEPLHYDDRRLYPFYAFCEDRNVPLVIMGGGNAGPDISFTAPEHIDRVLADFPELKIVSAHGHWPWGTQILHVAFRRPNLFLAPDYLMANMPGMDDYVRACDSFLADQFLFASAFPFAPVAGYAAWFRALPIRPANLEKIMGGTACRLLGLQPEG